MSISTDNNISNRYYHRYFTIIALFVIVTFVIFSFNQKQCYADSVEDSLLENIESQLDKLDLSEIERYISSLTSQNQSLFKGSFLDNIKQILKGEKSFDYATFFGYVVGVLFDDILKFIPTLACIVVVCIVCSFLGNISSEKQGEKINKIVYFACFALVAVMIFSVFKGLLDNCVQVLANLQTQMQLVFPILLTLITSIGSVVTVSTFQPAVVLLSSTVVSCISSIILPLFIFTYIFNIVGNMSSNVKLEKCSKFLSSLFKWLLGTVFAVFMSVLSLQGIMASVTDSISIKTTKFAIKSYIPLVGSYVSDGLGLILASGVLIKNAVGVTGLFVLLGTIIVPLVEIVVFMLGLKLVSAIIEPLSNNGMSNFIYGSSKCLNMLIACIVSVAFMYIITVGLLMCTSNIF